MAFTFTPLVQYTWRTADEDPVDPTKWFNYFRTDFRFGPVDDHLRINNGELETTTLGNQSDGQALNIDPAVVWPLDQFIQYRVIRFTATPGDFSVFWMYLRASNDYTSGTPPHSLYRLGAAIFPSSVGGLIGAYFTVDVIREDAISYQFTPPSPGTPFYFSPEDIFSFAIRGDQATGSIYFLQNGNVLLAKPLSEDPHPALTGIQPGLQLDPNVLGGFGPSNFVAVADFVGGTFSGSPNPTPYSVPDTRAITPNASRPLQGTMTYDVPKVFSLKWWFDTLFNRTQSLPVDSRAKIPADSRTVDNIPQNSRTNPPF